MQTQVGQPRTGREEKWYFEVYRGNQTGPAETGTLFDFDDVKKKIAIHIAVAPEKTIVRIIGPAGATREQLDYLRSVGANLTFP